MLRRSALLMLCALTVGLTGCAGHVQQQEEQALVTDRNPIRMAFSAHLVNAPAPEVVAEEKAELSLDEPSEVGFNFTRRAKAMVDGLYELPRMAGGVLERGFELLGTPYRVGGATLAGFDCSGFVSFLFREEAGIKLPRSTREMIELDVPKVARHELQPGDILFFNDRGRGRVSHTGIYIGDDQFIHSSSHKSGGVRVDSLEDRYWNASYLQAKRVLGKTPDA